MIWYILIILFITLLTWILLGPVILKLNTDRYQYLLMLPGVIKASVVMSQDLPYIRGWIFFVPFRLDLSKMKSGNGRKKTRKRTGSIKMIKSVPDAFRIRRLWLNLDTDDFMLNAWLIPAFSALNNNRNIRMQVNFKGHLFMDLDVRTRMASLLWILLKNR